MHSITIRRSDDQLCVACASQRAASALPTRHWLVGALYGRELLKLKLCMEHPDIVVPTWTDSPELDPLLEHMVDELDLRGWPQPAGIKARMRYLKTVLHMSARVRLGRPLPAW